MGPKEVSKLDQTVMENAEIVATACYSLYAAFVRKGFLPEQAVYLTTEWMKTTFARPIQGANDAGSGSDTY